MKPLILFAALAVACIPPPSPPTDGDDCDRAYGHLRAVECEPLRPESGTWVDVCRNARQNGLFGLKCINAARSIDEAQRCGVSCK
jgi:hypothetical protein